MVPHIPQCHNHGELRVGGRARHMHVSASWSSSPEAHSPWTPGLLQRSTPPPPPVQFLDTEFTQPLFQYPRPSPPLAREEDDARMPPHVQKAACMLRGGARTLALFCNWVGVEDVLDADNLPMDVHRGCIVGLTGVFYPGTTTKYTWEVHINHESIATTMRARHVYDSDRGHGIKMVVRRGRRQFFVHTWCHEKDFLDLGTFDDFMQRVQALRSREEVMGALRLIKSYS